MPKQAQTREQLLQGAVAYVLGPWFHLLNVVCRCPRRPGKGQQLLHRTAHGPRRIATTLWLIDDMTLANGPTRVVPGSHLRMDRLPVDEKCTSAIADGDRPRVYAPTDPAGGLLRLPTTSVHGSLVQHPKRNFQT